MSLPLSDADLELAVKALEHYSAYLVAARREDGRFQELADRLKRKQPDSEGETAATKKKKA
jgi:hypothetical protein